MPKSRHNKNWKKEAVRLAEKDAFEKMTRLRMLAGQLRNQEQLKTVLLQEPDYERRKKIFEFMQPHLKFAGAECPSTLEIGPTIIKP